MSPGKESALSSVYSTKTSAADYQQLCSLDVLGLEDRPETDEHNVHSSRNSYTEVRKNGTNQGCYGSQVMLTYPQMNMEVSGSLKF